MLAILIDLGFFQNQGKPGHEVQSSTLELMNGLVSLVHQQCMPDVASEAMEVSHEVKVDVLGYLCTTYLNFEVQRSNMLVLSSFLYGLEVKVNLCIFFIVCLYLFDRWRSN